MRSIMQWFRSMNREVIIVFLCILVAVIAIVIGLSMRKNDDNKESNKADVIQPATADSYQGIGNSDMSSISTDNKEKGKPWIQMKDSEYNISLEVLENGYSGQFVEDGTNDNVKKVLAIKMTNDGSDSIQYAEYVYGINNEAVSFKVTDLPPGESCVVQEMNRRKNKKDDVLELSTRVVVRKDALPSAQDRVLVVDNSDDTLTLMNLTDKELQNVRVFYKNYDESLGCYLGGVTYSGTVESIVAGDSITVAPEHFVSGSSVIMGSEILES